MVQEIETFTNMIKQTDTESLAVADKQVRL
jgi:hypothetical protein